MIRSLLAALVFVGLLAAAPRAWAFQPLPQPPGSHVEGPLLARPTTLRMERVRLSFAFADGARDRLSFEARYTVVNPGAAPADVAVVFVGGYHVLEMAVRVDGAPPEGVTAAQRPDVDEVARSMKLGAGDHLKAFRLLAAPGSRHEIRLVGRRRGVERIFDEGLVVQAVVVRHVLASTPPPWVIAYDFGDRLVPSDRWQGAPPVEETVTYPSGWAPPVSGSALRETRREGATTVLTRVTSVEEARKLELHVDVPPPLGGFRNGGALLGIGGTARGTRGARGRVGLEVAAPHWMLYSLTADTDFRRRFILTPLVEAASPTLFVLPSFGLGVGVPVQIAPEVRPGVRIQGDAHVFPIGRLVAGDIYAAERNHGMDGSVGLVVSGDVYPRLGALPATADLSVLAQVGF